MKICIITSGHNIFDSRIYYKEILTLKKIYEEIYLIAPGEKDFTTQDGIIVKTFKGRSSQLDRFRVMKEIYEKALQVNADVYHAHEPDSFQVAVKLKKAMKNIKIIYDSHEYHPEGFAEHFSWGRNIVTKLIYTYEKRLAKQADYIVTVNEILVEKFKKYNDNVVLLPNYPVIANDTVNKRYGSKPIFTYVGGLTKDRGILKILEGIKLVENDYKYVFIGNFSDSNFQNEVKNYVSENLKNKDVVFTGQIPHKEVFNYLEESYGGFVLLQPNNWRYINSEPIKLFEYMISKTAVIGADYPMIKNIVNKCNCGILAKADSPEAIADAIKNLGENSEMAKKMGERGHEQVKKYYNWDIVKDKLMSMYLELEKYTNKKNG